MAYLSSLVKGFGFRVEKINNEHLLIHAGTSKKPPRILLISHMDTVFSPESTFQNYEELGEGFVQGPGVGDIKGGIVIGLWAMHAISQIYDEYDLSMIVSANEEKGSSTIRQWYLEGHTGAEYCIGLEPGFPQGELTPDVDLGVVYQRRGYGAISYTINGKACHSGTPHLGINAIEAAAQRIIRLHQLSEPEKGISVTCGMVEAGISPNTVAGEARGTVSWRFEKLADGERVRSAIEEILRGVYAYNPGLDEQESIHYTVDTFMPPMEHTPENQRLIELVMEEVQRLGQNTIPIARGGGSDANYTSASGTPSICGMGAPAQGIHTEQEKIYLPGLYERIELLVSVLSRMISGALST